jgi:hypothetical protein
VENIDVLRRAFMPTLLACNSAKPVGDCERKPSISDNHTLQLIAPRRSERTIGNVGVIVYAGFPERVATRGRLSP